ncbi:esterase [Alteromonadaceae bacterium 2753L.S.0a.02]|nr:esterase [Alteromonadaceae bacterium 2753L.S.0a.02]
MPLHFKQAGSGKPVVLIHGLFGSLENLGMIARLLAEHYTVYSVDLPDHGRTAHTQGSSLADMAKQMYRWLEQQHLGKVQLFGHSLGGKVAMELALTYPERVAKLVVADISPVAYPPRHNEVFAGLLSLDVVNLKTRAEADRQLAAYVPELAVRSFLLKNLVKSPSGYQWRMNLPVLHRCYGEMLAGNRSAKYGGPTLFLKGAKSDYINAEHQHEIRTRFPHAQVKIIADSGHWLHADKPDLVARIITRFFS